MPEVRIEGARRFRADLKRAGVEMEQLKTAHAEVSSYVAGKAGPDAPVVSGRLRGSLRSSDQRGAAIVRLGSARIPYAGVVHYGWPARGIDPQPFVQDTIGAEQSNWLRIYDDAMQAILDGVRGI